jgi:hypothetical protein
MDRAKHGEVFNRRAQRAEAGQSLVKMPDRAHVCATPGDGVETETVRIAPAR